MNENNGVYQHGKAYVIQKRLEVVHMYLHLKDLAGKKSSVTGLQHPKKKQSFEVWIKSLSYKDEVFLLDLHKNTAYFHQ
eukprot:5627960-Ditylum_brightwellii.AAC.1